MTNCDENSLVCYLDIYSAIAVCDKEARYIKESVILNIPNLIKSSSNENLVNAAAGLLSNIHMDVSHLIDNII